MSDPIAPKRVIHKPNDASLRRAFHSKRDAEYVDLLSRVRREQSAEEFGRKIGILLHWIIVKPLQVMWLCLRAVCWSLANVYQLLTIVFVLCLLYLAGVAAWLMYLTYWS